MGLINWLQGCIHTREWKDDERHDSGKMKKANGDVYDEECVGDCMHGKGAFSSGRGGDEYEGMWKSPQSRYGPGRYGWAGVCLPGRESEARRKSDICSANIISHGPNQPNIQPRDASSLLPFEVSQQTGDSWEQSINQSTTCQSGVKVRWMLVME